MNSDDTVAMSFTEKIEYKAIELFKCMFVHVDEDTIISNVTYRFALSNYHMS